MTLLWMLLIGLIAGWLAGIIMKGSGYGVIGDIIIGILGALIGGHVLFWLGVPTHGLLGSLLTALLGAILLIFVVRLIKRV
ncbi:MAG TPA: GlsB/YeaQ/YmgE family stress response membrane protein [Bryobacteraceae bacterium]